VIDQTLGSYAEPVAEMKRSLSLQEAEKVKLAIVEVAQTLDVMERVA